MLIPSAFSQPSIASVTKVNDNNPLHLTTSVTVEWLKSQFDAFQRPFFSSLFLKKYFFVIYIFLFLVFKYLFLLLFTFILIYIYYITLHYLPLQFVIYVFTIFSKPKLLRNKLSNRLEVDACDSMLSAQNLLNMVNILI